MNRFGAAVRANQQGLGLWSKRLFERTTLCLEMDKVTNKTLSKMANLKAGAAEMGSDGGSTNPRLLQLTDKAELNGLANGVVISMLTLQNVHLQRVMSCCGPVGGLFNKWQSWMVELTQSADGTSKFIRENTNGRFTTHLREFVALLTDVDSLIAATFTIPGINAPEDLSRYGQDIEFDIGVENELATIYGSLAMNAIGEKGYRCLYYESFPYSAYECLNGNADEVIQRYRRQTELNREFEALPGKGPHCKLMAKRSPWHWQAMRRVDKLFRGAGFKYNNVTKMVLEKDAWERLLSYRRAD